jgi:endoglucanase
MPARWLALTLRVENSKNVATEYSNFGRRVLPSRPVRFVVAGLLILTGRGPAWSAESPATGESAEAAIRLNTIGYAPDASKVATIAGGGDEFLIRDAKTGAEQLRGRVVAMEPGDAAERTLRFADFSALDREGDYRIEILGRDASANFRIAHDIYNWPFYCAARAMYLWRCGIEVTGEFDGEIFHHEACHLEDAHLDHVGGPAGHRRNGTGGWHDAGDYNKYTVNGAFTAGMMLKAWEHFGDRLAPLKLDIPESGNDVPDVLDEARWEIDWLLKMQADDGRVYHKLSTLKFGDFMLPDAEKAPRYFSPWGSAATADFVAMMAQGARVFQRMDEEFAQRCLAAAKKSYGFLQDHPEDHRPDQSAFSTGPYDAADADDRLWAAAELWETTGEARYCRDFEQRVLTWKGGAPRERRTPHEANAAAGDGGAQPATTQSHPLVDADWDWANVRNLGLFTYLLSERSDRNPRVVARVRRDALRVADEIVAAARRHPYGRPLGSRHYWGCNGTVARQTMNLHVAYRLTGEPRYRGAMLEAISHLFGRNPFGRSYVTGLGRRPPMFPHDRRSGGDDVAAPWPGYLVGGPWPKATDWYDDQEDYRTNETAINWNGALIYALAAFVEPRGFDASIAAGQRAARSDEAVKQ